MKLKEFFTGNMLGAAGVGASRFRLSSDKEKTMTPHVTMRSVYDMLERRPSLRSGLNDMIRFLISDISVKSDDEKSVEFMTEWMKQRRDFDTQVGNFTYSLIGTGTGYMQPYYYDKVNGDKSLNTVKAVPDSSLMYKNIGCEKEDEDYWLMEIPFEVQNYDGQRPQYRPIWYIKGSKFYYTYIWCIAYPKSAYDHCAFGHSRNLPWYGFGLLSSAVDNNDIEEEILKNWALQAKYRALGKKIIGFYNTSDEAVSLSELEKLKEEFAQLEEEDSILVNKRFDQTDLSFSGQDATMDQQIDYLRKDNGSGLVPNYMTAFSQDSSMATAAEAKIPFGLQLKSIQPIIIDFLNKTVIERLRKDYNFLADDLTFDLGTPELYSREEVFNMIVQLYNQRAATFNELRKSVGLSTVEGGDVWGELPPLDKPETKSTPMKECYKDKSFKEALKKSSFQPIKENLIQVNVPKRNETESDKKENLGKATKNLLGGK